VTTKTNVSRYLGHWLGIGSLSFVGLVGGVVAQTVIAWRFGTTAQLDAFYVALLLSSYFPIVYQTAVADPFVPAYLKSGSSPRFASAVLGLTIASGAAAAVVLVLCRHALVRWTSPGFSPAESGFAEHDVIALALVPMFYAVGLGLTAVLASRHRFALARAAVLVVPVCQCVGILAGASLWGASALAWSTTLGYFGYALVLWASTGFVNPLEARLADLRSPAMRMLVAVGAPMTVTIAAGSLHAFIDRSMVSHLAAGSISILTYAERLNNVLCSVFLIPLTFVALPYLSSATERTDFLRVYRSNIRAALVVFNPIAVFAGGLSFELVDVALRRGSFSQADAARVGTVFSAYMIGIPFYAAAALTGRAFVASGKTWILAVLAPLALLLKLFLNTWLIGRYDIAGAALSTSIGYIVLSIVTLLALVSGKGLRTMAREVPTALTAILAASVAFVAADQIRAHYTVSATLLSRAVVVIESALVFALVYGAGIALALALARLIPQSDGFDRKPDVETTN
jgi:putative peptidoglycan lipid II flippase